MADHRPVHDRELLEALARLETIAVTQTVWRIAWRGRNVLEAGTGGRWTPASGSPALYTSETADGALAEIYHHLALAPVFSSSEVVCYPIETRTQRTVRIDTAQALASVRLNDKILRARDLTPCQTVGAAANLLDFDGLWVPNVRWPGHNLVLFPKDLTAPDALTVGDGKPVNWAAWRERDDVRRTINNQGI